jgi:hypothetical protein
MDLDVVVRSTLILNRTSDCQDIDNTINIAVNVLLMTDCVVSARYLKAMRSMALN